MANLKLQESELKKNVRDHLVDELCAIKGKMGFENDWQLIQHLVRESSVPKSSIHRILKKDNSNPTPETTYNLYATIYNTRKYEDLITKVPNEVADYFKKYLLRNSTSEERSEEVEDYILKNQLALRIYNESAGTGTTVDAIQKKYGEFGLNETHKLKRMKVVLIDDKGGVRLGKIRISSTPSNVQKRMIFNVDNYFRPFATAKKYENTMFNRIENTSPTTYRKIIDEYESLWLKVGEMLEKESLEKNDSELTIKFVLGGFLDKISED